VGPNNEWNHLTLEQAEEIHSQSADSNASEDQESNPNHAESIRMFVSGERTWLAVAGHPPDESKVVPLEFALLSIIASHKSRGITQPDLVKMSGQDKRSVPKRTDALQRKGYIDKRPIQTKSARTSLCTLRRFLHTATESSDQPQEQEYQPAAEGAKPTAMIDFDSFNNQLFGILREHGIIARDDLKRKMGFKDRWRWKVLSRAIRKWERIGVLKRVRAESQYEKLHPCVKLERDPTPTDLELFHEFNFEVLSKHGVEKAGAAIPVGTAQGAHLESSLKKSPTPGEGDMDLIKEEGDNALDKAEPARRVVPSWTPDRNLNNQIFDLINETGTTGITNMVSFISISMKILFS
jgi:transcription factor C subunit 3